MARALFDRGGDELRTEVGQYVVDSVTAEISGSEQSVVMRLMNVINEAEHAYFDVVQLAHRDIGQSGHHGLASDLPVIAPILVDRILRCCGCSPQGTFDANIIRALIQPYGRVKMGTRINEAALTWLKYQH